MFKRNSDRLSTSLLSDNEIPIISDKNIRRAYVKTNNLSVFRFNAHGELINKTHYENLLKIAEFNPKVTFGFWTKRKDLVLSSDKSIPKNVIMIYSTPKLNGIPTLPKKFNKVFTVYTKDFIKKNNIAINCPKSCMKCLKCYNLKDKTKKINEIIR